jgi:ATP-dependent Clp protease ATP-binding subunit ClpA
MPMDKGLHVVTTAAFKLATARGEEVFGTDNLLWQVVANSDSMGFRLLKDQPGVDVEVVKSELVRLASESYADPSVREMEHIAATAALVHAGEAAKFAQSHFTGTDHLVLGFMLGIKAQGTEYVSIAKASLISAGVDGRKLFKIVVPSVDERRQIEVSALEVLRGRVPQIEERHRVRVVASALPVAVNLSSHYVNRGAPADKAAAVVETAASVVRLIANNEAKSRFPNDAEAERAWADQQTPEVTQEDMYKVIQLWTEIPVAKLMGQDVH